MLEKESNSMDELLKEFPINVKLVTQKGNEIATTLVGRTSNYIITKNRDVIYLKDIRNIRKA